MFTKTLKFRTRHIISYVSIIVITCLLIGLLVLVMFNIEVNSISLRDYRAKMTLAVNDLDTQREILELVSFYIRISPYYRPFYTERNPFYELDIINDIAKYQNYSPIVSEYYCMLLDSNSVYSGRGKIEIPDFISYTLGIRDGSLTEEYFFTKDTFWITAHPTRDDVLIAIIPMRISVYDGYDQPNACIIFFITHNDFRHRIESISGLSADELILFWNGNLIWGEDTDISNNLINVTSDNGGFHLFSTANIRQIYPQAKTFRNYYLLVLMALTFLFIIIALFWGKRSYRSFASIITKLNIPSDGNAQDIEREIKKFQDSQHYSLEQFRENLQEAAHQRSEIAKRLLLARLNISRTEELDDLMAEAGISLKHPLFCVLIARCGNNVTEGRISALAQSISDEEMNVYSAGLFQPDCFLLILNFSDYGQEKEIASVLHESLESEDVEVTVGDISDDISMLHLSLVSAFMHKNDQEVLQDITPTGNWYDDREVWLVMEAIKEANSEKAQADFDTMIIKIKDKYPSVLFQRCICSDITNNLLKTLHGIDVKIDDKILHRLLMANDIDKFQLDFIVAIEDICKIISLRKEQISNEEEQNLIEYIKKEFYAANFTIFQVAEHFGFSDRKVGSIVKRITGKPYKEYIIHLRIERARHLLTEEHYNVAQTGRSVGYNNIPYFIKLFQNMTGFTPGEYKKRSEK